MKLRRAAENDKYGVWAVRTVAIRNISEKFYSQEEMQLWAPEAMPENYGEVVDAHNWYVIELNNEIVATGYLDQKNHSVEAIFVKPEQQGNGFARMILEKIEEEARSFGFNKLTLESTLNAEIFYKKSGYKSIEKSKYHSPRGFKLDCIKMEKYL